MFSDECLFPAVIMTAMAYLFYLFYLNRKKTFSYWKDRGVPYLEPDWLFGSMRNELLQRRTWTDFSAKCYNTFRDKGFGGIYMFSKPILIVCDPHLVEQILIQNFSNFHDRNESHFNEPMMKTLFNAYGESWRIMRSKLNPSFTSAKVKGMFEQIIKCCEFVICQIEAQTVCSKPVDVGSLMFVYSTEIIASCAFGIQLLSNSDQRNKFKSAIDNLFTFSIFRAIRYVSVILCPTLLGFLGVNIVCRSVSDFFIDLTKDTLRYRKQNNIKRNDFLNLLSELKDEEENQSKHILNSSKRQMSEDSKFHQEGPIFTEDRIAALVLNFITGGLKPSVATISFALLEIAKNAVIQRKVVEEIDFAVRKHNGWSYEAVRDMEYLDQVIQETLRMYSLSTVLIRMVTKPYTLPGTTLTLEKDLLVYIPIHPLHMDPRHYPSPTVFNPERFSDNKYKPTPTFMPFGNGPRFCIAMKFATTMMKVCLARVLFEYSVEVNDKTKLPLTFVTDEVVPKPVGGIWLSFCKRKSTI